MSNFFRYKILKIFFDCMKSNVNILSFESHDKKCGVILRHDIDYDVKVAYDLSLIEKECGIKSTFFVMVTCPIYNPLCVENKEMLLEMAENGFGIGLHFDPSIYNTDNLKPHVDFEINVLERIVNKPVKSISLHNSTNYGYYPIFDGYINTYDTNLFFDENYLSDSCGNFKGKNPFEMLERAKNNIVQMVLHPIYYSDDGSNFSNLIRNTSERLNKYGKVNPLYASEVMSK